MKTAHNTAQNEEQNATKPRVLMTTAMHQYRLLQPPPNEWMNRKEKKRKEKTKKDCSRYSFIPRSFWGRKNIRQQRCATNTWLTIQNLLRAFSVLVLMKRRISIVLNSIQIQFLDISFFSRKLSNSVPMNFVNSNFDCINCVLLSILTLDLFAFPLRIKWLKAIIKMKRKKRTIEIQQQLCAFILK